MAIKDEVLRAEISILPPVQQLAIRACFNSAKTPDGFVRKSHWEALLLHETYLKANLKIA
ncbi:uncharacterized protein LOC141528036 isoform X3 [Cotesia typhae]|uniref:uncharacterized protein LOC141528036 isoform X3 n=1 Tax=Cotesia typhae TaxID=2053667 RepID=UPI003D697A72